VGLPSGRIDDIEHGWFDPSLTVLQALALALDATVQELLDVAGTELGAAAAAAERRS
jgi:hypothetical protein